MAEDTTSETDLTGDTEGHEAGLTEPLGPTGGLLPGVTKTDAPVSEPTKTAEQKRAEKAVKAADARKASAAHRAAAKPGKAPDGMAEGEGNRDDVAELDMGLRSATMGPLPDQRDAAKAETAEDKVTRLERELAEARAGLNSLVPEEARRAMGMAAGGVEIRGGIVAPTTASPIPGSGPALWLGSIQGVSVIPPVLFRGSDNEAEAREQFQRHAGVKSTTGKIVVVRQGE